MWPFKQKLNLLKGCVVAKVVAKAAEVSGFEKEGAAYGCSGLCSSSSCPELRKPIQGECGEFSRCGSGTARALVWKELLST